MQNQDLLSLHRHKASIKLRPLKNGADNNSLPFQDHFCLKKGNYRG